MKDVAFEEFTKTWVKLNTFNEDTLSSLEIQKLEIEDWFKWHPDSPDIPVMREQYKQVCDKISNFNNPLI